MMNALLRRFAENSSGATAVEYALILALVCLAPMAAFGAGGDALAGLINHTTAQLISGAAGGGINVLP